MTERTRPDVKVVRLALEQIPPTSEVLARAFHDDPVTSWMIPDPDERARLLPALYVAAAGLAERFGEGFVTEPALLGAALWFPPGRTELGTEHFEAVGAGDLARRLPRGAFGRFASVMAYLDGLRRRDVPRPHWYLSVLGVEPEVQGRGIGGVLLQPILERCDSAGLPAYLETQKQRNVPFYGRHGFRVLVEVDEPSSGIRFWTMLREPAGGGAT